MMSRKGGFPPKKRKCPFRCSWRQCCIDISNRVTLALVWSILCGEKWNKNRRPKRHRRRVKGDMYKIHSLKYSHLYIKLSLNTCRWVGLWMRREGRQIGYHHLLPVDSAIRLPILENASLLALASEWSEEWCMRLPQTCPFLCPVLIWALHIIFSSMQHSAECSLE